MGSSPPLSFSFLVWEPSSPGCDEPLTQMFYCVILWPHLWPLRETEQTMPQVGVRELKNHTSEIIRAVRKEAIASGKYVTGEQLQEG